MQKVIVFLAFAAMLLAGASLLAQTSPQPFPEPTSAKDLFRDRPFGPLPPPTPTPTARPSADETGPWPREWWIGGGIAFGIVLLSLVYGALRASRRSNLFERQYRFPEVAEAALRLGGKRSGGHMATRPLGHDRPASRSETEDA